MIKGAMNRDDIRDLVVGGHVPIRFDLAATDLASPVAPVPIYIRVRRVAFLVQFVKCLSEWFQEFVSDLSCDPWLECDQLGPIPWQYPAGALYDLLETQPRPWRLRVHYSAFPCAVVMSFTNGANSPRAHFLNSLKQAAFLMFGTAEPIMKLASERIQNLFDSMSLGCAPAVLAPEEIVTGGQMNCLPVRFVSVERDGTIRVRQRPLSASDSWTIAAAFEFVTGASVRECEFVSHGVVLDPESDLNAICISIPFCDMFVYITHGPKKLVPGPGPIYIGPDE